MRGSGWRRKTSRAPERDCIADAVCFCDGDEMTLKDLLAGVRVRHTKDGWTGTVYYESTEDRGYSSHVAFVNVRLTVVQNSHDENGKYYEDPDVQDAEELEVIQSLPMVDDK